MKRSLLVISLLFSILFWGVNAAAFAQDQVIKKDTVYHKVKKEVIKKGDVKKGEVKKEVTKTVEIKKSGVKTEVTKKVEVKKDGMTKDVKEVKTVIKDKEVGKTADGKIIYEGPRGGKYTLSDKGKKVYIKKDLIKEVK
jgi:colicin import membrane protein